MHSRRLQAVGSKRRHSGSAAYLQGPDPQAGHAEAGPYPHDHQDHEMAVDDAAVADGAGQQGGMGTGTAAGSGEQGLDHRRVSGGVGGAGSLNAGPAPSPGNNAQRDGQAVGRVSGPSAAARGSGGRSSGAAATGATATIQQPAVEQQALNPALLLPALQGLHLLQPSLWQKLWSTASDAVSQVLGLQTPAASTAASVPAPLLMPGGVLQQTGAVPGGSTIASADLSLVRSQLQQVASSGSNAACLGLAQSLLAFLVKAVARLHAGSSNASATAAHGEANSGARVRHAPGPGEAGKQLGGPTTAHQAQQSQQQQQVLSSSVLCCLQLLDALLRHGSPGVLSTMLGVSTPGCVSSSWSRAGSTTNGSAAPADGSAIRAASALGHGLMFSGTGLSGGVLWGGGFGATKRGLMGVGDALGLPSTVAASRGAEGGQTQQQSHIHPHKQMVDLYLANGLQQQEQQQMNPSDKAGGKPDVDNTTAGRTTSKPGTNKPSDTLRDLLRVSEHVLQCAALPNYALLMTATASVLEAAVMLLPAGTHRQVSVSVCVSICQAYRYVSICP